MTLEADKLKHGETLNLSHEAATLVADAARDASPVSGLTHNHYKYPARFSPKFVRAVIEAFTSSGDLVLDPFLGGGTTMVEALALGRNCVGVDISSLATFVAEAKTLLLSEAEVKDLRIWALTLARAINMRRSSRRFATGEHEGYYRNIDTARLWRIRRAVEQALETTLQLYGPAEKLARCVVLRTAQWAFDARKNVPNVADFRSALAENAQSMISAAEEFSATVAATGEPTLSMCLTRSAEGIESHPDVLALGAPKLILTSPPYPGIHVLYHRWQVGGGKETPAPFLIANRLDGSGASYYTLGHRFHPELKTYFSNLSAALFSIACLCDENSTIVQVVAFNEPEWQLDRYLEVCAEVGLQETFLPGQLSADKRLWRSVPNRRWYADQRGPTPASNEVVLFHRRAGPRLPLPLHQTNSLASPR